MAQDSKPSWRCRHDIHQWGITYERQGRRFQQCERNGCLAERFISHSGTTALTRDCYGTWTEHHHLLERTQEVRRVLDARQAELNALADGL